MYIIAIKDENKKNIVGYKFWNGIQVAHDNMTVPEFVVPSSKDVLKAVVYTSNDYAENDVQRVLGFWRRHYRKECEIEIISAEKAVSLLQSIN